jgi:hypothetical protein
LLLRATPEQQYCTCGGPGTELLGLAKYYLDRAEGGKHEQIEVRIDSIDRVPEWIENVSWIKAEIAKAHTKQFGKRRDWPALFDVYPFTLDFSDLEGFGNPTFAVPKRHPLRSPLTTSGKKNYIFNPKR